MPRQLAVEAENNFSGGLITQATGLNFPPNSCTDTLNCIHHELGYARRRPGFDFEDNFTTKTIDRNLSTVVNYYWRNVTGDGTVNLLVAQIGSTLFFWLPSNSGFSSGALSTTVDLTTFSPGGAPSPSFSECQFATGLGYLFVVHPSLEPFYVKYNSNQTVTATQISVQIRDTEGLDDTLANDNRPASLSTNHNYNVLNQGWYVSAGSYLTSFHSATSTYPSNADVWWVFKNFDDQFDTTTITSVLYDRGTSLAPKGHYILNAFSQDRTTASGVAAITTITAGTSRPSTVEFFAGRAWYAGTAANGYESKVYFSQVIQNINQAGRCYSAEDPTAQDFDNLEVDDGGWLVIPGIGLIYKLVSLGSSLMAFGSQGVFQITGSTGTGFTAVDYSVNYISSVKSLSGTSFVNVDGFPAWWTLDGIYLLTPSQQGSSSLQVQSLTDQKIKEYYLKIDPTCKRYARGAYDPRSHTIQWIFKSSVPRGLTDTYSFDSILNYNVLSQGFYPWSVPNSNVAINGIFLSDGFGSIPSLNTVVDATNPVVIGSDTIVETSFGALVLDFSNKFLVSYPNSGSYKFTFADYANTDYVDWFTYDSTGIDYSSFFLSGYKIPTAGAKRFQPTYLYLFSDLTIDKSAKFYYQSEWDFANDTSSGKISSLQLVNWDTGQKFDVVRNKLKLRGSGFVVQHKIQSISGEPFNVIGWTVSDTLSTRD